MTSNQIPRLFSALTFITVAGALAAACGDGEAPNSNQPDGGTMQGNAGTGDAGTGTAGAGNGGAGGSTGAHDIPDSGDAGVIMCAQLGTLCHPFDTGSGKGHDCHEVGHEGDPAACAAVYDECIAFCQADAGDGGSGHEHQTMCEVLGHVCHALDDGGSNLAHECHEVGHAGDEVACGEMYPVCISLCSPQTAGDAGAALCEELGHACHALDDGGSNLAHECHEVGHAGDVAACAAIYGECMDLCGGHHHATTDAGDAG